MPGKHYLIFVPGLGDNNSLLNWAIKRFEKDGFITIIRSAPWHKKEEPLKSKLERLINRIDEVYKDGQTLSLIGISAGASLVLNAYCQRKNKVENVVNICGRLRKGKNVFPSLELASRGHPAFKESVELFEKNEPNLTDKDRKKILTIRAFWDEIVPRSTTSLNGATNIKLPLVEHSLTIYLSLLLSRKTIVRTL